MVTIAELSTLKQVWFILVHPVVPNSRPDVNRPTERHGKGSTW